MKLKKDAVQVNELKQLRHLFVLVEGIIVLSIQNQLCDKEIMIEFCKEKRKLARLILATETGLAKYISEQQILVLSRIAKIGKKLLPAFHEKSLVASVYVEDFLTLVNELYKKNLLTL